MPEERIILRTPTSFIVFGSQLHPGHIKIVCNKHVEDVLKLTTAEQTAMLSDVMKTAKVVNKIFKPERLNYQLLGNWEPHVHWHIYPRYKNDLDFGQPIMLHWKIMGKRIFPGNFRMKEKPLTEKQFKRFKAELEKEFAK